MISKDSFICKLCLEAEGVVSSTVVEHRCTDHRTGKQLISLVCTRCVQAGRETRVTCRTFTRER